MTLSLFLLPISWDMYCHILSIHNSIGIGEYSDKMSRRPTLSQAPSINTLSIMTFSIMTLSIVTLSIMTLNIMTLSIMTLSIMTLSIVTLIIMRLRMITPSN